MSKIAKAFLVIGALSAAVSVMLGAAAAHMLQAQQTAEQFWVGTALQYHQFHALGLLLVGVLVDRYRSRWLIAAGCLMVMGLLLFCGNLYLRGFLGFSDFHAVTPYGGGAFIMAWLALACGLLASGSGD